MGTCQEPVWLDRQSQAYKQNKGNVQSYQLDNVKIDILLNIPSFPLSDYFLPKFRFLLMEIPGFFLTSHLCLWLNTKSNKFLVGRGWWRFGNFIFGEIMPRVHCTSFGWPQRRFGHSRKGRRVLPSSEIEPRSPSPSQVTLCTYTGYK
jgi:hypothetical protein